LRLSNKSQAPAYPTYMNLKFWVFHCFRCDSEGLNFCVTDVSLMYGVLYFTYDWRWVVIMLQVWVCMSRFVHILDMSLKYGLCLCFSY